SQRDHDRAGLHAWPLLGQHEFTSGEIAPGLGEQDRKLQRAHMITIEILMQAVIVVRAIVEHERGWPYLARRVAAVDEFSMLTREPSGHAPLLVSPLRN